MFSSTQEDTNRSVCYAGQLGSNLPSSRPLHSPPHFPATAKWKHLLKGPPSIFETRKGKRLLFRTLKSRAGMSCLLMEGVTKSMETTPRLSSEGRACVISTGSGICKANEWDLTD